MERSCQRDRGDDTSFRFATRPGHLEAGVTGYRAEQGTIPVEDAAVDDPPTEAEAREAQLEQHPEQARTATGRSGPILDESHPPPLCVLALDCTLEASPARSSSDRMIGLLTASFAELGATCVSKRVVHHDERFGESADEGDADGWPSSVPKSSLPNSCWSQRQPERCGRHHEKNRLWCA